MNRRHVVLPLLGCALVAGLVGADVVHLANGNTLRGEVVREDEKSIVLRTSYSEVTISTGDVVRVERESPADRLRGLAEDALRHRRYERALRHLHAALEESPNDGRLHDLLARAYEGRLRLLTEAGRFSEATELAGEAAKFGVEPASARKELAEQRGTYDELRARAEADLEVGQYERALEGYQELLRLAPARRGQLRRALAQVYLQYGDSFFRERGYAEARARYEEALRLDPELLPELQRKLTASALAVINGVLEEAQRAHTILSPDRAMELTKDLQDLLVLDPDLPHTRLLMGVVYEHLRRPELALSEYELVLGEAVPGRSLAERLTAARLRAQELVRSTPLEVSAATPSQDWAYSEPGDWQEARSEHFRLLHHNPRVSQRILAAAEYHLKREAPFFDLPPGPPWPIICDILLYRDAETYHRVTGRPTWSPAVSTFTSRTGVVRELAIHTHQEARLVGQTVIPHEIGHLLLARVTGYAVDLPLWLQEGVAVSQEPDFKVTHLLREVAARRQAGTCLSFDEVVEAKDYPPAEDVDHYYGLSYTLVQHLLRQADFETFRLFALASRQGLASSLEVHYGVTVDQFRSSWEEFLEEVLPTAGLRPPAQPAR